MDPGSEIRDPGWVKIRSRDKNPGSATLILTLEEDIVLEPVTVEPVNSRGNIGLKKKDYEKILALLVVVFSSNNFISFSFIILKQ